VLRTQGDISYGQRPYWAMTVRASWWWFLALPAAALLALRLSRLRFSTVAAALLCASPSAVLLLGLALSRAAA